MNKVIQLKKKAERLNNSLTSQRKENHTGLPADLKTGIEQLSGYLMDDVKVHYNSSKPAELNAYAYAQGTDIYIASGQEKYLPHEAWHVVQQKQGRVKTTTQMNGGLNLNDDVLLEKEATIMGEKALEMKSNMSTASTIHKQEGQNIGDVIQLAGTKPNQPSDDGKYRVKLSSEREEYIYNHRVALELDAILPPNQKITSFVLNKLTKKIAGIELENVTNPVVTLETEIPEPSPSQRVLCIDTVGYTKRKETKLFIDIKIGQYTKSNKQFTIEGASELKRKMKGAEHWIKDYTRDSRGLGYDIDAGNKTAFNKAIKSDKKQVIDAMKIALNELRTIERNMKNNGNITFVGSSLFIVLNLDNSELSDVKLIDPDHPILIRIPPETRNLPLGIASQGNLHLKKDDQEWAAYCKKYTDSFDTGMTNFITEFKTIIDGKNGF